MGRVDALAFFTPAALENPHATYARMRSTAAVCAIGDTRAFLVCTREAIEAALGRQRDFSANLRRILVCGEDERPALFDMQLEGSALDVIATADDPEHTVHRRLMMPPLKAARIAALEPSLREFARSRIEAFRRAGGGDFCAALAEPLPAWVVMQLLGFDEEALDAVRRWAMMGGDLLAGRVDSARMEHLLAETAAQLEYLSAHFDRVRAQAPADRGESLSATLAAGMDDGLITREEAIGILVILFGAAGESTASLLGSCARLLAGDPALQDRLRAEPSLLPAFVEEATRLETPFKFHYRHVRRDCELGDTVLRTGDVLLLGWAAANRDPACWEQPDTVRLDRPRPERHLGFGHGIHFCIGAPLARLEVRLALEELLAGTAAFALDPERPPRHVPSIMVRRLEHLYLKVT